MNCRWGHSVKQRTYYYGVDLVRFVCALMVAAFHIGFSCWASPTSGGSRILENSYAFPNLAWLLWPGWVGVEIFFVISGFVISASAEKASAVSFVKGRMLRLYPAAWVCATITLLLLINENDPKTFAYPTTMALFPLGPWIDGQYWTLGVEIAFYALIFMLIAAGGLSKIFHVAAALGIASTCYTIAVALGVDQLQFLSHGVWRLTLLNYGADFAIGVLLLAFAQRRFSRAKLYLVLFLLIGVAAEIYVHAAGMSGRTTNAPFELVDRWPLPFALFLIGVGAIMASVRYSSRIAQAPQSVRSMIRAMGLATYPLYLIHFSIGIALVRNLVRAGVPPLAAFIGTLIALTLIAFAIASYIEPRIRAIMRRMLDPLETRVLFRILPARFVTTR